MWTRRALRRRLHARYRDITQRRTIVEGIKAIIRLFTEPGGITIDGSWFKLHDAHLQLMPYQKPHMPIFVASSFSPSGMVAAGELGCGVLSIAAFAVGFSEDLRKRWKIAEETAQENGKQVDRANWRIVVPVHLADSREEALRDVRAGNLWLQEYFIRTLNQQLALAEYPDQPVEEITIDKMAMKGGAIIGTPDDAIARIKELQEFSGGFGGVLMLANDWAPREKTLRSCELWARYVTPKFQGTVDAIQFSNLWARERKELMFQKSSAGILTAVEDYAKHKTAKGDPVADFLMTNRTR